MKKIIIGVIALVIVITGVCAWIEYDKTHYTAYIYQKGEAFNNGYVTGNEWYQTGEKISYTLDELKELAKDCSRISWRWDFGGAIGFTLTEDTALVVPGLAIEDGISKTYYLTF